MELSPLFSVIFLITHVLSHPGDRVSEEAKSRADFIGKNPRTVNKCPQFTHPAPAQTREINRRGNPARVLPNQLNYRSNHLEAIQRRDIMDVLGYNHRFTSEETDPSKGDAMLFTDFSSYMLQSETTEGPYYVNGELIRSDISEGQDGIPLYLDIQLIDTSLCRPMQDVYVDIWQCNATGVYSGVTAVGNGDFEDNSNLNKSFLRGVQPTNSNGVVQFHTIFPGHYEGRTTHIHILVHHMASTTVRSNGTLEGDDDGSPRTVHASHVGQLFFDTSLINEVEAHFPYNTNAQPRIHNWEDAILMQEADTSDPLMQYLFLGDMLQDGIFAWIMLGIDPDMDVKIKSSSTWYEGFGRQWRKLWR